MKGTWILSVTDSVYSGSLAGGHVVTANMTLISGPTACSRSGAEIDSDHIVHIVNSEWDQDDVDADLAEQANNNNNDNSNLVKIIASIIGVSFIVVGAVAVKNTQSMNERKSEFGNISIDTQTTSSTIMPLPSNSTLSRPIRSPMSSPPRLLTALMKKSGGIENNQLQGTSSTQNTVISSINPSAASSAHGSGRGSEHQQDKKKHLSVDVPHAADVIPESANAAKSPQLSSSLSARTPRNRNIKPDDIEL